MARKIGPVRQFSLQCETPTFQVKRPTLKKQYSEEIPDKADGPIRISLSAKGSRTHDRPAPIKLAWTDETDALTSAKCKETKAPKPSTKDSILCPKQDRQDLAERLRQAWQDREKSKQNLSIFLTQTSHEDEVIEPVEDVPDTSERVPKIIPPMQAEVQEPDLRHIFRKHLRDNNRNPNITSSYSPTRTDDGNVVSRSDAIVVVPIIERPKPPPPKQEEPPMAKEEPERPATVMSRPSTAASKREMFQKRTNSAFQTRSDNFRPPLIRASSVPSKPENKPKFLATKRRVKTAKRKDKIDEEDKLDAKKGDIVTMVSLVSPSGSENEEEAEKPAPPPPPVQIKEEPPAKNPNIPRKLPKSVSFQQSSIHSVRSFSASFPSRRGSVATALLIGSASKKLSGQKPNEKRAPNYDEQIGSKRRLLRAASVDSRPDPVEEEPEPPEEKPRREEPSAQKVTEPKELPVVEEKKEEAEDPKEKECWNMFCKMNERGLTVSFDTILRGMLTPTEYRVRRKLIEKRESESQPS